MNNLRDTSDTMRDTNGMRRTDVTRAGDIDFRNVNSLWCSVFVETLVRRGVSQAVDRAGVWGGEMEARVKMGTFAC
ncbi:hypothetical protein [Geminisphaera colitermitum]|uniref:hypothetical protein n=1 Tax=Geminisphaera colitermitum TaxID=1148786 RepID=UPI0005BA5E64|nr:hypothetical protein [Geminisphaera colitermitum]